MLLTIRVVLILYGIIALGTGFLGITAAYDASTITPAQDNNHRFVAAIWASMTLAFFYTAWQPSEVALFRFLMIAVFIGGLVRAYGLRYYPPSAFMIFGIFIELIPPALLVLMHIKLLN